jgi:hypothetical protein
VYAADSGSCEMAVFGISGVELSASVTVVLIFDNSDIKIGNF